LCSADDVVSGFYRGTAGSIAVHVCFDNENSVYYAENSGKSINLSPMEGPGFRFLESEPFRSRFAEDYNPKWDSIWELNLQNGELSGQRTIAIDAGGETQTLTLQKVSEDCDPQFEEQRLGLPFKATNKTREGNVEMETLVHPVTGVRSVRILYGIPEKAAEKINRELAEYAETFNTMWIECSEWEGAIVAQFVSPLWIIFDAQSNGYCGGAHPNEDADAIPFLSETGEQLNFRKWIDPEFWSEGIQGKLKEELVRAVEEEGCIEKQEFLGWQNFQPWMGSDLFYFRLGETDRAYVYCEGDYGLPFNVMREFIAEPSRPIYDRFVASLKKTD